MENKGLDPEKIATIALVLIQIGGVAGAIFIGNLLLKACG